MWQSHVFIVGESSEERTRRERRRHLRDLNTKVWDGETGMHSGSIDLGIFKLAASLDSSLKKNTAFIKRLRTGLNSENQAVLLKDISSLSLEKYIPEVVGAASEGLQKCKTISDILAAIEVRLRPSGTDHRSSRHYINVLERYLRRH
jgi:regulator of nonsense transcripts 2